MNLPDSWDAILEPGERILWQGRPDGGVHWGGFEPQRFFFGLAFTAFAVFWTVAAVRATGLAEPIEWLFPAAGLVFIAVGARMIGAEMLWDAWLRRHSWYALSTRRAFVARKVLGWRTLAHWRIDPATIIDYEAGPPGSIRFAGGRGRTGGPRHGFHYIAEAPRVLGLMRRVQRGQA